MKQNEMANERAKEQSYKVGNSDRRIHYNLWSNHYFHVLCNVGVLNVYAREYRMQCISIHSHGRSVARSFERSVQFVHSLVKVSQFSLVTSVSDVTLFSL